MKSKIDVEEPTVVDFPDGEAAADRDGALMAADEQPHYGVDSPAIVAAFVVLAAGFTVFGILTSLGQGAAAAIGPWVVAVLCMGLAAYMIRSSRAVKRVLWARQLDALDLRGTERVLDAGCGRGLVTVELANRLPRGSVVGVDIWRTRDQTGNTRSNAERNIRIEGVADRVELVDASMEELPFDDDEFDVVTASLSLHCLALAKERGNAMKELMRVTKPGGRIVILDVGKTFEYQAWLNDGNWDDVVRGRGSYSHYPPVRAVTARKPR